MASKLSPYLNFGGNAREALQFYREVFGGTLSLSTFGEFGAVAGSAAAEQIMHGQLDSDLGYVVMAADIPPGMPERQAGNDVMLCVWGDDVEAMRGYFAKLADGGRIEVPLEKQMWGDEYGACVDAFGVSWGFNICDPQ